MFKKIFFIILLIIPVIVLAKGLVPCGGAGENPCDLCSLITLTNTVINFLVIKMIMPVGVVAMITSGIMILFAGGDPGKITQGRNILKYAVIGMIIAFAAWLIVDFILGKLLDGDYKVWNKFPSCEIF